MLILLALACAEEEPPVCESFPDEAAPPATVLENSDSCGYWEIPVGDQLVLDIAMSAPDYRCTVTVGDGLSVPYDGTYSYLTGQEPKQTFQVFGEAPVERSDISVVCEEGTEWAAQVQVTED